MSADRLDDDARQRLSAAGASLQAAIAAALDAIAPAKRTSEELTSRFGIEGVVARRIIRAVNAEDPLTALTRIPNAHHLHALAERVEQADTAATLRAATDAYTQTLTDLRLDPVRLKRALRASSP